MCLVYHSNFSVMSVLSLHETNHNWNKCFGFAYSLINLHIFLYGCNIVMWRRHRINYIFIFEFARKRELKYQDVFLICTTFMTIVAGCMVAQLALREKRVSSVQVDTIPGLLLLVTKFPLRNI